MVYFTAAQHGTGAGPIKMLGTLPNSPPDMGKKATAQWQCYAQRRYQFLSAQVARLRETLAQDSEEPLPAWAAWNSLSHILNTVTIEDFLLLSWSN